MERSFRNWKVFNICAVQEERSLIEDDLFRTTEVDAPYNIDFYLQEASLRTSDEEHKYLAVVYCLLSYLREVDAICGSENWYSTYDAICTISANPEFLREKVRDWISNHVNELANSVCQITDKGYIPKEIDGASVHNFVLYIEEQDIHCPDLSLKQATMYFDSDRTLPNNSNMDSHPDYIVDFSMAPACDNIFVKGPDTQKKSHPKFDNLWLTLESAKASLDALINLDDFFKINEPDEEDPVVSLGKKYVAELDKVIDNIPHIDFELGVPTLK